MNLNFLIIYAQVLQNPIKSDSISQLVGSVIDGVVSITIVLLVLFFVFVGIQFLLAQGNKEKLKDAKQNFLWGTVGAIIVLSAKGIQIIIEQTANKIVTVEQTVDSIAVGGITYLDTYLISTIDLIQKII